MGGLAVAFGSGVRVGAQVGVGGMSVKVGMGVGVSGVAVGMNKVAVG